MIIEVNIDEHKGTKRSFVVLESPEYFMTIDEGNIFTIFKFNKVCDLININKHFATYNSAVDAFKEFYRISNKKE